LQAIARVNRPYEDSANRRKPCGFVLDFVGIFDNLEKALAFDSEDVSGVIEGIDALRERFAKMMESARETYLPITAHKSGDKAVEAVLEHFRDKEKRETFYQFFKELQDIYEILSPDAFLRPFLNGYEELLRMYYICKAAYDRQQPVDREFLRKTAKLVQEQTQSGEIEPHTKFHEINAQLLEAIAAGDEPDTVKIFNLLKALAAMVADQGKLQPFLISVGDRAEEIAQRFEERQITTQQALAALQNLVAQVKEAEKSRDETRLTPEAFAVFYNLKNRNIANALDAARAVEKAFEQFPHWRVSEKHERNVRQAIYKVLDKAGVEEVVEVGSQLMNLLRRASL